MSQPKLWTKNFIAGTAINFLLVLNYYLLMIIMTEYSANQYGASSSVAGLSASMFVIGALFARFFSAQLMKRFGTKHLLIFSILLEIAASVLYLLAVNIWILFFIRFMHGMSYGVASTSISTVITSTIPKERNGEGVGYYMLSITLGAAIGPFLGMFLINNGGYFYIFVTCTAAAVVCLPACLAVRTKNISAKTNIDAADNSSADAGSQHSHRIFEAKAVPISLVCAGIYFCYSSIISFLTPYTKQIDLQTAASFFFVVYSIVILATRPFTGKLFDTKGDRFVMLPAFVSFFIGMIMLGMSHSGVSLLLSAAFLGFGVGVIQSCGLALAVKNIPAERISYANSTFYIFIDTGTGIGPFLLGFIIPVTGYRGMYLAMAVLAALFCLLYLFINSRTKKI